MFTDPLRFVACGVLAFVCVEWFIHFAAALSG